jgi:alpha-N-arabinofuranosidase
VNPTEEAHSVSAAVEGAKLRGRGKLYQIAPAGLESANQAGKEPVVKIVETDQASFPETVQAPPVSISVYEFEVEKA